MKNERSIDICKRCPYAHYRDERVIFCGVCMRKILDEMQQLKTKKERKTEDSGDDGKQKSA